MYAGLLGADSARGVVDEQSLQEIETVVAHDSAAFTTNKLVLGVAGPFGEAGLEVWEAGNAGPILLAGCAENTEDFEDLVNFRVAGEERLAGCHLGEDAADGPHVNTCAVLSASEKNFRGAVPESDDLLDMIR